MCLSRSSEGKCCIYPWWALGRKHLSHIVLAYSKAALRCATMATVTSDPKHHKLLQEASSSPSAIAYHKGHLTIKHYVGLFVVQRKQLIYNRLTMVA